MTIRSTLSKLFIVSSLCIVMWSCNKADVRELPSGYKYTYVKKGDGDVVKAGEVLVMDMAIVDSSDSLWYDNRVNEYPELVKLPDETVKATEVGITELFRVLAKGDSVLFSMRAKDFFPIVWRTPPPRGVNDEEMFTFQILCRDVMDETGARTLQRSLDSTRQLKEAARYAEMEKQMMEASKEQLGKDTVIIDNYLRSKGMKATALPSGLRYILKGSGRGPLVKEGDLVNVKYAGQTLDGQEFDSGEYAFTIGRGEVIPGWEAIARTMKRGTSLTVFIPSTLAYGKGGRPPVIMPDAVLIFDMEILTVN